MRSSLPLIHLVRHGETEWSLSGRATGRTDLALSDQGEMQARALQGRLQDLRVNTVLTSPLRRATQTGVLAGFGARLSVDEDLVEWDHGVYEGLRTDEILADRPGWNLLHDGCPGGELLGSVSQRADRVIGHLQACIGDVLVFAHRDILRVLAVRWLGLPAIEARGLYLATASVSVLGYHHDRDEPVIRLWNDCATPIANARQHTDGLDAPD